MTANRAEHPRPLDGKRSGSDRSPLSVTVVICTHNRPAALKSCLRALQCLNYPRFAITVVDSAPISSEAEAIARRCNVGYAISSKGLSHARNAGIKQTETDIVAYLDDDMLPHADWLKALVAEFAENRVMAVAGPVMPLKMKEATEGELRAALEVTPWGPRRFQIDRLNPEWFERANFGGIGDGNFAVRRSAFDQFPGFDERLGRGAVVSSGEEHYAYYMLLKLGFTIAYAPNAIVFHPSSSTNAEFRANLIAETIAYSCFLIYHNPTKVGRVIKYCIEGLFHRKRPWRYSVGGKGSSLSLLTACSAVLNGLGMFLKSVRTVTPETRKRKRGDEARPVSATEATSDKEHRHIVYR